MTVERCPTCQQPLKQGIIRSCYDCGEKLQRHDKYTYQEREGILTIVHRVCNHPTMHVLPSEYRRLHGDAMADQMGIPEKD